MSVAPLAFQNRYSSTARACCSLLLSVVAMFTTYVREVAVTWTQNYDPLGYWWLSTLLAALPILVLLGLLAGLKIRPHICAIAGAASAVLCAMVVFKMPAQLALTSFAYGVAFGLLKIVWIVVAAVFLYD